MLNNNFHKINFNEWQRSQYFYYFTKILPTGYNISVNIDITNTYRAMVSDITINIKKQATTNIYTIFEKEFGRPLSPVEYEIIKAWITSGISEELIKGALKEAVFNNVRNLRYIDKILSEWEKKGFKSVDEVDSYLKKKESNNPKQELFDYNWLEDEE